MKILAIESSGLVASAAIYEDGKILAEYTLNYKMTHSETLMPAIKEICEKISLALNTLDYIACSMGPGSFTGLRIGAATAKGLALALNKPIIPVPTLDSMAYNIYDTDKTVCPIMDARRHQVYAAVYKWENNELLRLTDYFAEDIDYVMQKVASFGGEAIFLGDGITVYRDKILSRKGFFVAPYYGAFQRAALVAALGEKLAKDGVFVKGDDFKPFYIRKPQAERELEEKKAGRGLNV
ncbi:MAG: tRNA (adenosine(37)-N6)-threonylcarbamoyltransferase complex dimerization subunit type 1 TsaB [Lachnospiraceae bacterium]|nr:tRNA (adenosine(37)-N6)-threonylcarbamoyltransferase complex dimerization subunit type 1 TsaB [Lachnospiraceae bacterium]